MPRTNIGTVEIIEDGQKRSVPVTACPGYGITCYALGVTNGYIIQVAQTLKNMVSSIPKLRVQHEDPSFDLVLTLEGEVLDVASMSLEALYEHMKALYEKYDN